MEAVYQLSRGTVHIPCKCSWPEDGPVRRVVIGVHGLGGSYDDPFQLALAEEMELFSSAVVRFCLPCHGDSPLAGEEFTLRACLDSLEAVAADALARFPQARELCIFASGFGAYVTLCAMDSLLGLGLPMKVVVQAPCVRMDRTVLKMCRTDPQTLWALNALSLPIRPPVTVTYSFFEELVENHAVNTYPVPMLIIHSRQDRFVRLADVQALHNVNEQSRLVLFDGNSHEFLEQGGWGMVLDLTRDWFEFGQVLLCDTE